MDFVAIRSVHQACRRAHFATSKISTRTAIATTRTSQRQHPWTNRWLPKVSVYDEAATVTCRRDRSSTSRINTMLNRRPSIGRSPSTIAKTSLKSTISVSWIGQNRTRAHASPPFFSLAPPSFREREPEAPRYTGSTVPSRSFRFLQMMTSDDQQQQPADGRPSAGYNKPQQQQQQPAPTNKYDEQTFSSNANRIDSHPSRAFKYLQGMTGEQPGMSTMTTVTHTGPSLAHVLLPRVASDCF